MFAPALRAVISTACAHPFVKLRQLKLPQSLARVRWESVAAPTINGVLYNAQMSSDINGCDPGFTHGIRGQNISMSF